MSGPKADRVEPTPELRRNLARELRFRELISRLTLTENEHRSLVQKITNLMVGETIMTVDLKRFTNEFTRSPDSTLKKMNKSCEDMERDICRLEIKLNARENQLANHFEETQGYRNKIERELQVIRRIELPKNKKMTYQVEIEKFLTSRILPSAPQYPNSPDSINNMNQIQTILGCLDQDIKTFRKEVDQEVQMENRDQIFNDESFQIAELNNALETLLIKARLCPESDKQKKILSDIQKGIGASTIAQKNEMHEASKEGYLRLKKEYAVRSERKKKIDLILARLDGVKTKQNLTEVKKSFLKQFSTGNTEEIDLLERSVSRFIEDAEKIKLSDRKERAVQDSMSKMGYQISEKKEGGGVLAMIFDKEKDPEFGVQVITNTGGGNLQIQVVRRNDAGDGSADKTLEKEREEVFCDEYESFIKNMKDEGFLVSEKHHVEPGKTEMAKRKQKRQTSSITEQKKDERPTSQKYKFRSQSL